MSLTRKRGRKLLVASLGVAAVSYVGCGNGSSGGNVPPTKDASVNLADGFVGNLMAVPTDAHTADTAQMAVGNLVAPPADAQAHPDTASPVDATGDAVTDTGMAGMGVGNLMAPPPDSGQD